MAKEMKWRNINEIYGRESGNNINNINNGGQTL
jgi:hypothetical protein